MDLGIGDLVQCRDTHYTRGLGIVGRIGMVAELRRRDLRVLFDADDQSTWLTKPSVNRIVLRPAASPTLLDRLTWLLHFVAGRECELEIDPDGRYRYTVVCGGLGLGDVLAVRDYMQPVLVDLRLIPRGMSRIGLEVVFRRPAAGGAP
jgi:hypothetical protein